MTDKFGKELKIGDYIEFEITFTLQYKSSFHIGVITDFGIEENNEYLRVSLYTYDQGGFSWTKTSLVRLLTQEETMIYLMENA